MKLLLTQSATHRATKERRGVVLAAAISMLSLLGILLVVLLDGTAQSSKWTDEQLSSEKVDTVADTAISLAAERIWSGFERIYGPDGLQPWNFRSYLDTLGIIDQKGVINPVGADYSARLGLTSNADGSYDLGGGFVQSLTVVREDEWDSARLTIGAVASLTPVLDPGNSKNQTRSSQVFQIQRPEWQGLDYALLANNVNCIMCHATVDDAARYYNNNPSALGSFDRVRVGSLESFHVRSNPDSTIAGALYLGGSALQEDGSHLTDWAGLSLKSSAFDGQAKLIEDAFGGLTRSDLSPADALTPAPGENLYLDYLQGGLAAQVDGILPDYFPSPFPDNGGFDPVSGVATPELGDNRVLDHNEFVAATGSANGSIVGGTVAVVPYGTSLGDLNALDSALLAGGTSLGSVTQANVVLHGTELNPIIIDGPLAIDGDVVLSGYIKGRGAIMASGNVFIPSDVQFLDGSDGAGNRTYGVASDGTVNSLGIASGGNITIGDPTHPALGRGVPVDGTPNTPFNFIMDEVAIFNRGEWIKTQPQLPGEREHIMTGTQTNQVLITPTKEVEMLVDEDIYEWQPTGNMLTENVYDWVQTGTRTVDDYQNIHHAADPPEPYGSPWTERVWVGSHEEPVYERQVVGTRQVPEMASVYIRTDQVLRTVEVPDGAPYFEDRIEEVWEWVTPMHDNPDYMGANFVARYYAFDENTPIPIFNKKGYYEPATNVWHSAERPENWTNGRLTLADPTDRTDPILYDASGKPKAVVSIVTPDSDWLSNAALADLVDRELGARKTTDPVAIDATLYSGNSLFGVVPARGQPGVNGSMLINGGLVAADIGLLAPMGIQINYDPRNRDLLNVSDDRKLTMRRALWAPAPQL